jgi:hypothetical protein
MYLKHSSRTLSQQFAGKFYELATLFEAQHFQKFFHCGVTQFEMGLFRCPHRDSNSGYSLERAVS